MQYAIECHTLMSHAIPEATSIMLLSGGEFEYLNNLPQGCYIWLYLCIQWMLWNLLGKISKICALTEIDPSMLSAKHFLKPLRPRVTHKCVSKLTTIGSDKGLSPGRRQAIIWTNAGILLIGPLGINVSESLIEINTVSFNKMHLKMSSAKWRLFRPGLNELNHHLASTLFFKRCTQCVTFFTLHIHTIRSSVFFPNILFWFVVWMFTELVHHHVLSFLPIL